MKRICAAKALAWVPQEPWLSFQRTCRLLLLRQLPLEVTTARVAVVTGIGPVKAGATAHHGEMETGAASVPAEAAGVLRSNSFVNLKETIVAVATPPGRGGLGVVRI